MPQTIKKFPLPQNSWKKRKRQPSIPEADNTAVFTNDSISVTLMRQPHSVSGEPDKDYPYGSKPDIHYPYGGKPNNNGSGNSGGKKPENNDSAQSNNGKPNSSQNSSSSSPSFLQTLRTKSCVMLLPTRKLLSAQPAKSPLRKRDPPESPSAPPMEKLPPYRSP